MSQVVKVGGALKDWTITIAQPLNQETKTITISETALSVIYSYIPPGSDFRRQELLQRTTATETVSRSVLITPETLVIEFGTATIT